MHRVALFINCFGLCTLLTVSTYADTVSQSQHLNFGRFVLKRNDSAYHLKVKKNGTVTGSGAFIVADSPVPAIWDLTDFPANTLITVTIPDATLRLNGSVVGNFFTITDFESTTDLTTNSSGNATLKIGATLYTSGSGTMYTDGSYSGNVMVTISY